MHPFSNLICCIKIFNSNYKILITIPCFEKELPKLNLIHTNLYRIVDPLIFKFMFVICGFKQFDLLIDKLKNLNITCNYMIPSLNGIYSETDIQHLVESVDEVCSIINAELMNLHRILITKLFNFFTEFNSIFANVKYQRSDDGVINSIVELVSPLTAGNNQNDMKVRIYYTEIKHLQRIGEQFRDCVITDFAYPYYLNLLIDNHSRFTNDMKTDYGDCNIQEVEKVRLLFK